MRAMRGRFWESGEFRIALRFQSANTSSASTVDRRSREEPSRLDTRLKPLEQVSWNFASSSPGTDARTVNAIVVILNPPPVCGSTVHAASVSTYVAGVPFFSRPPPSAMLKHAASAAARSSSGFDPAPSSKRELKLY